MVAVELNAPDKTCGYRISRVASAYGLVPAECMRLVERGLLRYRNAAKSLEWMNDKGLQLPNSLSATQGSWSSVPTEDGIVKVRIVANKKSPTGQPESAARIAPKGTEPTPPYVGLDSTLAQDEPDRFNRINFKAVS